MNLVLPDVSAARWDAARGKVLVASRGVGSVVSADLKTRAIDMEWDLPTGTVAFADDGRYAFALDDAERAVVLARARPRLCQQATVTLRAVNGLRDDGFTAPARCDSITTTDRIALDAVGDPELARGRKLFHQANNLKLSGAPLACASCHRDGRDDGRTWLGEGSTRQTPMLSGRDIAHTAPYGWNGAYARLEDYLAFTIASRLQGNGLGKSDLAALARYVREGLRPVTVAAPSDEQRDDVRRGRVVFHAESTGCASCHPAADAFTDGAVHDVRSIGRAELANWRLINTPPPAPIRIPVRADQPPVDVRPIDWVTTLGTPQDPLAVAKRRLPPPPANLTRYETPSLLRVGVTAPYLHDGSAKTLDEVFVRLGDHMGTVSTLTERERSDLVAYLRTL
jgi:cytochrome c peroxidase